MTDVFSKENKRWKMSRFTLFWLIICLLGFSATSSFGEEKKTTWAEVKKEVSEAVDAVGDAAQEGLSATKEGAKEAWKNTKEGSAEAWQKTKETSKDVASGTTTKSKSLWQKTKDKTKEIYGAMKNKLHQWTAPEEEEETRI